MLPLHCAITSPTQIEVVQLLVEITNYNSINDQSKVNAETALYRACTTSECPRARAVVEYLLACKVPADVNLANNMGITCLMWAAILNDVKLAKLVVAHGAEVNASDHNNKTAIRHAAQRLYMAMLEYLRGLDLCLLRKTSITSSGWSRKIHTLEIKRLKRSCRY